MKMCKSTHYLNDLKRNKINNIVYKWQSDVMPPDSLILFADSYMCLCVCVFTKHLNNFQSTTIQSISRNKQLNFVFFSLIFFFISYLLTFLCLFFYVCPLFFVYFYLHEEKKNVNSFFFSLQQFILKLSCLPDKFFAWKSIVEKIKLEKMIGAKWTLFDGQRMLLLPLFSGLNLIQSIKKRTNGNFE